MFRELTDELLDLRVTEKGYRNALFAALDDPDNGCSGCSCSCSWLCISLCCTV